MKSNANLFEVYPKATSWIFDDELKMRCDRLYATGYDAYCLYVPVGYEIDAAADINIKSNSYLAMPFMRMMHRSNNGVKTLAQDVLLGGYIFLYVPHGTVEIQTTDLSDVYRHVYFVLENSSGEKILSGSDLKYAQWVLSLGGIIGVSKAIKDKGLVKIIGGPLYELQDWIKEYDRRSRGCRIEIDLVGKQISAWLPIEWVESESFSTMEAMA